MNYFQDITIVNHGYSLNAVSVAEQKYFDNYYGLQYVYSGSLYYRIGNSVLRNLRDVPVVFITGPGISFTYGSPPGTTRHHAHICFRGPRVDRWLRSGLLPFSENAPLIKIHQPDFFRQTMIEISRKLSYPDENMYGRAVLQLENLLLQLQEQDENLENIDTRHREKIRHLCASIVQNPCSPEWNFPSIASRNGISYGYFRNLFQQLSGHSPKQYLLECRLKHAELLLTTTSSRIKEIAYLCQFNDEFHFSKIFKKHRGLSPLAYRRKYSLT